MKIENYAITAEIVGAIAIVVTLVILIVELRGNTDVLRAQTINAAYQAEWQRRDTVVSNDGGIAEIIVKSMSRDPRGSRYRADLHRHGHSTVCLLESGT